jgi:WD40 repeat protein
MMRKARWVSLLWVVWLAACLPGLPGRSTGAAPSATLGVTLTPAPTETPAPTFTPTPTSTATPTLTPTPVVLVGEGEPLPADLPPLTLDNAAQVSGLAAWQEKAVTDMEWLPGGSILAVANAETISLYDVATRQILRSLYPERKGIMDIAINPSGNYLVTGSRQGSEKEGYVSTLELWRGPDWKPLGGMYGTPRGLSSLEFSANGKLLAGAFASPVEAQNSVEFWSTLTWVITGTVAMGPVLDVAFSPVADLLAATPNRYALKVWDLTKKDWLFTLHTSFTGAVNRLAFSPDGQTLASGHYDGTIRVWDMQAGGLLFTIQTDEVIESLVFSPDGQMLASGGSYANSFVRLWDAHNGALLNTLEGNTSGVGYLLFSPDSRYLVSGSYDGMLRLWGVRP